MPFRVTLPRRLPLLRHIKLPHRSTRDPGSRQRPNPATISPTSARVSTRTRQLTEEADVLWWRWRHLFLEAKALELEARQHEGH